MTAMSYVQQELLNRKAELNEKILKAIESARAHGVSLNELAANAGVSRRCLLSLRKHHINEVSYDYMYMIAISLGIVVQISIARVIRA